MTSKYLPMFPEAWDDGSGTSCTNATWNVSSHDDVGGGGGEPLPSCADDSNSVDDETSSADMVADADTDAEREEEEEASAAERALTTLRSLVQATFASLVSASAARGRGRGISFPRLFTRLVETTTTMKARAEKPGGGGGTPYTEFRTILTGMMEAYRAEGDVLVIAKRLLDRDVFETVEMAARARARGWAMRGGTCAGCRLPLMMPSSSKQVGGAGVQAGAPMAAGSGAEKAQSKGKGKGKGTMRGMVEFESGEDDDEGETGKITIMRTGIAYHGSCLPLPP